MDRIHFKAQDTISSHIFEWEQYLKPNKSISEISNEGYLFLRSLYDIHNYVITDIDIIEGISDKKCEGCENDQPGQLEHMSCPNGCLHIHENCDICKD